PARPTGSTPRCWPNPHGSLGMPGTRAERRGTRHKSPLPSEQPSSGVHRRQPHSPAAHLWWKVVPRLEIIWQQDATAHVFTRDPDDSRTGERRIDAAELVRLADAPPDGLELGGSARTTFAIVELAQDRKSVV